MSETRALIECSKCVDTLDPEENGIVACPSGHSLCQSCLEKSPEPSSCDHCGNHHSRMEKSQLLLGSIFSCRYLDHGCNEKFPWSQLKRHEAHCDYRPFACPFAPKCNWFGIHPQDHLSVDHGIPAIPAPYQAALDWVITSEDGVIGDGDFQGDHGGTQWNVLIGCPYEDRERHWFLLTAEFLNGSLSVQMRSLNFDGEFVGTLVCAGISGDAQFCWDIPSLRNKKKCAILPENLTIGFQPDAALSLSKSLTLTVSISPNHSPMEVLDGDVDMLDDKF